MVRQGASQLVVDMGTVVKQGRGEGSDLVIVDKKLVGRGGGQWFSYRQRTVYKEVIQCTFSETL